MKPYSQDLRDRIGTALDVAERSQPKIAEQFGVSLSFVEKLKRRIRESGSCAALPHAGGRDRGLKDEAELIRAEVAKQPDVTLGELCERVEHASGTPSSPSMMWRELQRLRLRRKKSPFTTANGIRRPSSRSEPTMSSTWSRHSSGG